LRIHISLSYSNTQWLILPLQLPKHVSKKLVHSPITNVRSQIRVVA
jgi:hypothetical protein